ncbi:hypothetical protein PHYC_01939 [Phycisphaerales bacterium]|nr:hypothetical protein PHYC_01939 [Phycisphaerales bacterium]
MIVPSARRVAVAAASFGLAAAAHAGGPVIVPGNGFGTVDMPPNPGVYSTPAGDMHIIDGLAPGDTIDIDLSLHTFFYNPGGPNNVYSGPGQHVAGGTLGGGIDRADGTLSMPMTGTGSLAGYNRVIPLPVSFEIHTAPRGAPFSSPQSFDANMHRFFGQIAGGGDPDFDLLRIVAGNDFGLPSPGHTTLTDVGGGQWNVESFFDITYRIDFVGHPGGPFSGRSGSTTGTVRIVMGEPIPAPGAAALLMAGGLVLARRRR